MNDWLCADVAAEQLVVAFRDSAAFETVVDKAGSRIDIIREHGNVYVQVDDLYYQVEDGESRRTWVIVEAEPGIEVEAEDGETITIDFEEL